MDRIFLYILKCSDGTYYTGTAKDLERRLEEHFRGIGSAYTSKRRPLKLVYSEGFEKFYDAFKAERQIKGWTRKKKEALIAGNFDEIVRLSNLRHPSTSSG